jgi:prepilin-type N-terminal cleavage/methylation domain-containing protein
VRRRFLGRLAREQEGFTLVEMMVASAMALIVVGGGMSILVGTMHSGSSVESRTAAIQRARVAVDQLTREVRQGSTVATAGASQLSLVTFVDKAACGGASATTAIQCLVTYNCSGGACTRTEARPDGSGAGSPRQVVTGLASNSVFGYSPSAVAPTYVSIRIQFPGERGDDAVTLTDGAALRNAGA